LAKDSAHTVHAAPPPEIEVRFVPGDRFTDVGGSPLALLAGGSAPLDRQSLDRLAEGLALETWPEGQPVAGRVQVQALAPDWQRAQITFLPDAALRDRWYRLHADLSEGLKAAGEVVPAGRAGDGSWGVRFRTGAQLVVRRLRACREGQDLRLDLTFSERLKGRQWRGAVAVSQGEEALRCEAVEPAPPAGESKDMDLGAGEIAFHCAGPSTAVPIDVKLGRTLAALGGLTAGGPEEALAYRLRPLQEWPAAEGCLWLAPTGSTASGQGFDAGMEVAP
jgi:hypothetical protein